MVRINIFILLILLSANTVFAQSGNSATDTMRRYYSRLANSRNQADRDLLQVKLYELLKSNKEEDWSTAQLFFSQLRNAKTVDSISKEIIVKFPLGNAVRNAESSKIFDTTITAATKESMYKAWIKKFPPKNFDSDKISYDYVRSDIANAFAKEDNLKKTLQYVNMIETRYYKGMSGITIVQNLLKYKRYKEAKLLVQESIDNAYKYKTIWKDSTGANYGSGLYSIHLGMYATILYEQGAFQDALDYQQKAFDATDSSRKKSMNGMFAKIYMGLGRHKEAFDKLDESVKLGMATYEMKETLKVLYRKVKGDAGFDEYMAEVNRILGEKIRKDLANRIINQPAPAFTLTDLSGKLVSLSELKGKVVVVDFWATWCGPCKASFPTMQTAVNKYKADPKVEFLFIHTWEREEQKLATDNASKYIKENKYSFNVLMDLKDSTGANKVVSNFNVTGIPTKFVIDENGNIRFKFVGFSVGGDDAAVEEIAAMIELARIKATNF